MSVPFGRAYWENLAKQEWMNMGYPEPTSTDRNYDAFRHTFTSATWTRYFGETIAREGGDYIERSNPRNFDRGSTGMRDMNGDLLNNAKGREIGKSTHPGWTQETLGKV